MDLEKYLELEDGNTLNKENYYGIIQPTQINMRVRRRRRSSARDQKKEIPAQKKMIIGMSAAAVLLIIIIVGISSKDPKPKPKKSADTPNIETTTATDKINTDELFAEADAFYKKYPKKYDACIIRFKDVFKKTSNPKHRLKAEMKIGQFEEANFLSTHFGQIFIFSGRG